MAPGLWRLPRRRRGQRLWVLLLLVGGCRSDPEPTPQPSPPTDTQLREDLVGATFAFMTDDDGPRSWTIEADEIRRFRIVGQVLDDSARVARSRVGVLLRAAARQIEGELDVRHVWRDSAWVFDGASRAGADWIAGDAEATIYAVEALTDTTMGRRTLAFDLIARFERGRYVDPLARFDSVAFDLAAASFETDSLRQVAIDSLGRVAGASVVRRGQSLYALRPGTPPVRIAVDSVDADVVRCEFVTAFAPSPTPEAARQVRLGTSSAVMGRPLADGGPVGRDLARALLDAARAELAEQGHDVSRIRQWPSTAADLDGDGAPEAVGVFSTGGDGAQAYVVVAVEANRTRARTLFSRRPGPGYRSLHLLGVLDVDADGAVEALFLEDGASAYRYLVVTYRGGRYTDAFRGGGGAC